MTVPLYNLTDTWNNGATTFTAIQMVVTDTASTSSSLLMDLQVAGSGSQFNVTKDGAIRSNYLRQLGQGIGTGFEWATGTDVVFHGDANLSGGGLRLRGLAGDAHLTCETSEILSLAHGTTAQGLRVYNTTDSGGSNYERGVFDWTTTTNVLTIGTQAGGTGTKRDVALWTSGTLSVLQANAAPIVQFSNNGGTGGQVLCRDLGSMSFGGVDMSNSPLLQSQGTFPNSYVLALMDAQNNNQAVGFHVYNTADATVNPVNYERGVFDWTTTVNTLTIGSQAGGTGVSRDTQLVSSSAGTAAAGTLIVRNGFAGVSGSATVTVTIASPAVFSLTAHGYVPGQVLRFTTTGALPTGLSLATNYYVIAAGLTANAFEVSATPSGTAVNTSGTQSGTHTSVPQTSAQNPASTVGIFGPSGLTGSQAISALSLTQTWNTSGAPTAILMNVTNTASAAGSLLMDLQVGGVSQFKIDKTGNFTAVDQATGTFSYYAFNGLIDGISAFGGARWGGRGGGSIGLLYETDGIGYGINHMLGWSDNTRGDNAFAGSHIDVTLSRNAAGILQLNRNKALTSPTGFQVYNTTDAASGAPSNYERGVFDWTTSANILTIGTQAFGSGNTRLLRLIGNSTVQVTAALGLVLTASGGSVSISSTGIVTMDAPLAFSSAVTLATPITASTYSQAAADSFLTFNASGTCTVTLLNPAGSHAFTQLFVRTIAAQAVVSASSNVIPLAGGSAGTAILAATAGKWAMLQSDGTSWQIVAAN